MAQLGGGNSVIAGVNSGGVVSSTDTPAVPKKWEEILALAKEKYGYIDILFLENEELQALLIKAVDEEWEPSEFATRLTGTQWFISNGSQISERKFSKNKYESLIASLDKNDPKYADKVKAATANTDYARGLDTTKAYLETQLTQKGISYTPEDLTAWAADLYDTANEKNASYISRYLNLKIGFSTSTKGAGATDMASLTEYAQDQGLDVNRDFSQSDIGKWMQRLDKGESLDAIKKEIDAVASVGETEQVQNLMKQGLTRKTIYSSLVNRYNTKLDRMDKTMNDPWFQKNAKDEKGNLLPGYELDKKIMADKSTGWDLSPEAHQEYSDYALNILKDFGLTGGR